MVVTGILVGLVALIVAGALIGGDDDSGETVPAAEWADNVCGTVGRVARRDGVDRRRCALSRRVGDGRKRIGRRVPQGQTGSVRTGLEQALLATETMVEGISRAGIPDTPNGQEAADGLEGWADDAVGEIEQAQEALGEDTDSTGDEIEQLAAGVATIVEVYASGGQAVADAAVEDPELLAALAESETC